MRRAQLLIGASAVFGLGIAGFASGACSSDRGVFTPPHEFVVEPDAGEPACYFQCSLDGRSIQNSCSGEVVETCPDHLACGGAKCQEPCAAAAADRSSNGCEFYFSSPRYLSRIPQSCHAAFVVNSSTQPAILTLERDGKELPLTKSLYRVVPKTATLQLLDGPIAPGESAIVFVSDRDQKKQRTLPEKEDYIACPHDVVAALEADFDSFGSTIAPAFHLKSNVPVGVTSMFPYGGAASHYPSATLAYPVSAWAKEHMLVSGWESTGGGSASAQIYAAEDDTEVTIIGKNNVQNGTGFKGAAAGVPAKIKLARGQFVQLYQVDELTGSFVFSNKPTLTVGGHGCGNVPSTAAACDTLEQQIPPFEQWGSEYVAVAYRPRLKGIGEIVYYRIVAAREGTELDYDPVKPAGAPLTLAAGEHAIFRARADEPFVVRSRDAEHPFYVAAHMSGGAGGRGATSYGGMGDPDFVNVVPAHQYLSSYSFYADTTYPENSLVIIRKKTNGAFKDVWLECAGNLQTFKPVGTRGEYEYTRVDLSRNFGPGDKFGDSQCITGLQRLRSEGAFSATIWGWGLYASYAYPGGVAMRKLVDSPLEIK